MKLHQHIMHHVQKHHKKYLFGAGILSGVTIAKFLGMLLIFLGLAQSTHTGADYYDLEYEKSLLTGKVYIDTVVKALEAEGITGIVDTGNINTGIKLLPTNQK